jgi:lipoprotein-anchoring transpeptidase ErfK/SrfK
MTHPSSRAGIVLLLALILLVTLAATVWAAWGTPLRAGLAAALNARLTATPTKTPRPATATPAPVPVDLAVVAFTATPLPPQAGAEAGAGLQTNAGAGLQTNAGAGLQTNAGAGLQTVPPYLAKIVAHYGMDPTRRFIVVDPDRQRMTIWEPGQPVRELPISTGDPTRGYRTPAWYGLVGEYWGTFQAFGVYADEGWYLFEDVGSILIHGAPYKLVDGVKVYEELDALGNYPASRGCIRLRPEDARWFTAWGPQGVPLVILPRSQS